MLEWEIGLLAYDDLNEELNQQIRIDVKTKGTEREKQWFKIQQGDYILNDNPSDFNKAYSNFKEVLIKAKAQNDSVLVCEALKRLIFYGAKYSRNVQDLIEYGRDYENYAYSANEKATAIYRTLTYETQIVSKLKRRIAQGEIQAPEDSSLLQLDEQKIGLGIQLAEQANNSILKANLLYMSALNHNLHLKNVVMAKKLYRQSCILFNKYDFAYANSREFDALLSLGALEYLENKSDSANIFFYHALKFRLPKQEIRDLQSLYSWMSRNYEQMGISDSALKYLKKRNSLERQINQINSNISIQDIEVKYQTAEKEKQLLVQTQKTRANRNLLIAAGIALFLGSGIALLLQKNTTKKRQLAEQEAILKQQRVDNLLKEQELVSIDAMIAGQEKERQKVAGELHDDLGSLMATIKLHFDKANTDTSDPALEKAQFLLEEAYQKIRGMAHSKNSGVMSDQGLLSAIKKMAKTISETNALDVEVEHFGLGERMENSLELSIFRIIQELVANAIKHAEASKINVQLTQHEENLNIIVEDNGKGFVRSQLGQDSNGMGLTNIEKRVEHLEGNFTVDSVIGKGTSILIDIPV
ncbi:MAG: sensor histidine kinase [Bacteroidota bacterium]